MDDVMGKQANMSTPEDEVTSLMQQVAEEHGLELQLAAPAAGRATPAAASAQAAGTDPLTARLADLKAR